jgi:hypothetical protein
MRLLLILCCALLAGCNPDPDAGGNLTNRQEDAAISNRAGGDSNLADAVAPASNSARPTDQLFDMPESTLRTECAMADAFPNRQVPLAFYRDLPQPQFDHYLECVLAEARHDGGRVRLAGPGSFPTVGSCVSTRIRMIGTRFAEGRPEQLGGTSVGFDDGLYLVDYGLVGPVARSRVGDRARVCVDELPEDCPAYDIRGIQYRARNLRTGESWTMANSQHVCRGA